jgi:NitT/TauT family transport system permease protein
MNTSALKGLRTIAKPALALLVIITIWEIAVRLLQIPKFLLCTPSAMVVWLIENFYLVLPHAWVTFYEIILGFIVAVIVGVGIGVLISISALFRDSLYPLVVISQVVPKVAIAPLFVIWFGYGIFSKVFLTFIIAFFPVCVNTIAGLTAIEPESLDLVRSYRATTWQVFTKLRLPTSLPYVFTGMEVAMTLSSIGAIVSEFVGAGEGLGFLIITYQYQLKSDALFAIFVWISVLGLILWASMVQSKKYIIPWYVHRLKLAEIGAA